MSLTAPAAEDLAELRAGLERVAGDQVTRRLIRLGAAIILGLAVCLVLWMTVARLGSAVVAGGVVSGNRQMVQHPDGGVVAAVLVQEGQLVRKGQELVRLDDVQVRANLDAASSAVDFLSAMAARLEAEQSGAASVVFPARLTARSAEPAVAELMRTQGELFLARRAELSGARGPLGDQVRQAQSMASGAASQASSLDRQLALVQEQLDAARQLQEKGFASKTRVMQLEQTAAAIAGQRDQSRSDVARFRSLIDQIGGQSSQLHRDRQAEVWQQLADARTRLAEAEAREHAARDILTRTVIRSPANGYVLGLSVKAIGSVIGRGERILEVVPTGSATTITARIRPADGANVHAGMAAELRLVSPEGRNLPRIRGTIKSRSNDTVFDAKTGDAAYLVEVTPDPKDVAAIPGLRLTPGTPMEVTVSTGSRTAFQYMLEPVLASFRHGLQER